MAREDAEGGEEAAETGEREAAETGARPRPQLRWVQVRNPRKTAELGRNGRVVESFFHEKYDSWEVLLVTYEGEVDGE